MTDRKVLFLAPHQDDETLFGAFTLLREKPLVIVVLQSRVQWLRGTGISAEMREAETAAAMEVLGCRWEQWRFSDAEPDWPGIERRLMLEMPERVYAPAVERDGNEHHTRLGLIADRAFGQERVTHYLTYTNARNRSNGARLVEWEPGWIALKLRALACYTSQLEYQATGHHFLASQLEFYES